jgi:adenylate kinase family enzyme
MVLGRSLAGKTTLVAELIKRAPGITPMSMRYSIGTAMCIRI